MKKEMSAKDKAFEEERIRFRKEIRSLKCVICGKNEEISNAKKLVDRYKEENNQLRRIVHKLQEYTKIPEEDLAKLIDKELKMADAADHIKFMLTHSIFGF